MAGLAAENYKVIYDSVREEILIDYGDRMKVIEGITESTLERFYLYSDPYNNLTYYFDYHEIAKLYFEKYRERAILVQP